MLAKIEGEPLILRVYNRVKDTKLFANVIVATDDLRILKLIEENGGKAIMTSEAHVSGTDRIIEASEKLDDFDFVVNVQGDEALIDLNHLGPLVTDLNSSQVSLISTLYTVNGSEEDFKDSNCVKATFDESQRALYFSRSPIPFSRDKSFSSFNQHVGVYAFAKEVLSRIKNLPKGRLESLESLEQLRWLEAGISIKLIEVKGRLIGVDNPSDIKQVENLT